MEVKVTKNKVLIVNNDYTVNQGEYHANACNFIFSEEYTSDLVKKAVFSQNGTNIEMVIVHNGCDIPAEFLNGDAIKLGVYAYEVKNDNLILRYSPTPTNIYLRAGSYTGITGSGEEITPTQFEQYEQALHDGLEEVDNVDIDVSKSGKVATVEITNRQGVTKSVSVEDGADFQYNWSGTSLGVKTDEEEEYQYVDLKGDKGEKGDQGIQGPQGEQGIQGIQGPQGIQGEAFTIKKTYSSVAEMNADFNNMQLGDYVMIASTVEVADNAKLYTRGESQWIFISDFSGATGIQGPQGPQGPQGVQGPQGETGPTGATGATGNGIASIVKTGTSGLVDTYTITYTDGTTTTFEVTNGEDGEVTQSQLNEVISDVDYWKTTYNSMAKVTGNGTDITLDDTGNSPMEMELSPSEISQATTTGKNLLNPTLETTTSSGVTCTKNQDKSYTLSGTSNANVIQFILQTIVLPAGTYRLNASGVSYTYMRVWSNTRSQEIYKYETSNTFTLEQEEELQVQIYCQRNAFAFNGTIYPMITRGDSSQGDYEPYTGGIPSPNPDYPQDIHVVSGDNEIDVVGKNLLKNNLVDKELFGVTVTHNPDNTITLNGTATRATEFFIQVQNVDKITLKANKNYIISRNILSGTASELRIAYHINGSVITFADVSKNLGSSANDRVLDNIRIYVSNGTVYNNCTLNIMVEQSAQVTEYEPYQEQSLPLNLPVKNLFDKNATTDSGHYLVSNGTIGNSSEYIISDYIKIEANTSYVTSGMVSGSGSNPSRCYYDKNKSYISGVIHNGNNPFIDTSPANAVYLRDSVKIADLDTIQIEKGTKANSYTPYGTPALEYCKIGNYEDEFVIPSEKNLFDESQLTGITMNGITWSAENNKIKISGTSTSTYSQSDNTSINLQKGTYYFVRSGTTSLTYNAWIYNIDGTLIANTKLNNPFTINETATRIVLFVEGLTNGTSYNQTMNFQISKSNAEYEPYNNGKWYLKKTVGKHTMTSSDILSNTSTRTNTFRFTCLISDKKPNNTNASQFMCNRGNGNPDYYWSNDSVGICEVKNPTNASIIFSLPLTEVTSIETAQAWFQNNTTKLYYFLETPQYILLNDTLQAQLNAIYEKVLSYQDQTNISQTNDDLPFVIKASACYDLNKLVERVATLETE